MTKTKKAAALKYDPSLDDAPKLLAKAEGYVAEKMVDIANESGVKIYKDEKLANQLSYLEAGDTIPEDLYEVVAEVLLFIAKVDDDFANRVDL